MVKTKDNQDPKVNAIEHVIAPRHRRFDPNVTTRRVATAAAELLSHDCHLRQELSTVARVCSTLR